MLRMPGLAALCKLYDGCLLPRTSFRHFQLIVMSGDSIAAASPLLAQQGCAASYSLWAAEAHACSSALSPVAAAGPMVQEAPPRVNGTHLPSLKASSPSATIPEGHLFETADTERSSASRTSPGEQLSAHGCASLALHGIQSHGVRASKPSVPHVKFGHLSAWRNNIQELLNLYQFAFCVSQLLP